MDEWRRELLNEGAAALAVIVAAVWRQLFFPVNDNQNYRYLLFIAIDSSFCV
jgi:ribosomal 50S subunit-associated protein YjgA (DUF615 family)